MFSRLCTKPFCSNDDCTRASDWLIDWLLLIALRLSSHPRYREPVTCSFPKPAFSSAHHNHTTGIRTSDTCRITDKRPESYHVFFHRLGCRLASATWFTCSVGCSIRNWRRRPLPPTTGLSVWRWVEERCWLSSSSFSSSINARARAPNDSSNDFSCNSIHLRATSGTNVNKASTDG